MEVSVRQGLQFVPEGLYQIHGPDNAALKQARLPRNPSLGCQGVLERTLGVAPSIEKKAL